MNRALLAGVIAMLVSWPGPAGAQSLKKAACRGPFDGLGTFGACPDGAPPFETPGGSIVTYRLTDFVPMGTTWTLTDVLPAGVTLSRLFSHVYAGEACEPWDFLSTNQTGPCKLNCIGPPSGQGGTVRCAFTNPHPGSVGVVAAFEVTVATGASGLITNTATSGQTTASASFIAVAATGPTLAASPQIISRGQSATLFFSAPNATSVTIDNGVQVSGTSGSVTVSPTQTTTYTLTATGPNGIQRVQVTIVVITTPAVLITGLPRPILQNPGIGGGTGRISLTNTGGGPAVLSLTQVGTFFTVAPASFTIAPGATQTITVTTNAQPAGIYDGMIRVSGSGIPSAPGSPPDSGTISFGFRLLVQPSPVGTVKPIPATNRVDVSEPSGTLQISNSGSATLQGILASDVPWLIPQEGIITISPGQSITATFTIDRSKRPDADNPDGTATGNISLVYFDGTVPGATAGRLQTLDGNASAIGTNKVVVIDLVVPVTSTGAVPPLGPGEVAFFLPGVSKRLGAVSDVLVNAAAGLTISDIRMFFAPSASSTSSLQFASLKPILAGGSIRLSDVVKGVFGRMVGESGGLQVRSQSAGRISLAGFVTNPSNATGLYTDTLASFRSDRSVGTDERLVLAGVRSDTATRTDLYLQETAGKAGSAQTDFLDEAGVIRKSRMDSIAPFGVVELSDEVPRAAVTVTVTNVGPDGSRLQARAVLIDQSTGDVTDIVDWNRRNGSTSMERQIIVLAESRTEAGKKTQTDLAIANLGSIQSMGTLSFHPFQQNQQKRRRTARSSSGSTEPNAFALPSVTDAHAERTIAVEPGHTVLLSDVVLSQFGAAEESSGYIIYTPVSGTASITARTYASLAGGGRAGTGVPVIPVSRGLRQGEVVQFVSLEDASPETIRAGTRATYRTGFTLIETAGKSATAKVTLRYQLATPGGRTVAQVTNSKEYALGPRQAITVKEMSRALFGPGRDQLDDLHDLTLEVGVTSGEGTVVPYTLSVENGSGDTFLRVE